MADATTKALYADDPSAMQARFDADLRKAVTLDQVATLSSKLHALGAYHGLSETSANSSHGRHDFNARFGDTAIPVHLRLDPSGTIARGRARHPFRDDPLPTRGREFSQHFNRPTSAWVALLANVEGMPIPIEVVYERTYSGTPRRIFQLLSEMGTSADAVWPFAAQPFLRSPGPLTPQQTEEWHLGLHAILEAVEPERRIVWRIDNEGVEGTHEYSVTPNGKQTTVRYRLVATLSETEGRLLWKRVEDAHQRAIEGLFDKLGRVLRR